MYRFVTFVDGSNLVGVLRRMNLRVEDYEALFRHIFDTATKVWKGTFDGGSPVAQLHGVKWYEVGSLDEWNLGDAKAQAVLRDIFDKDRDLRRTYMALAGQKLPGRPQAEIAVEAWSMCFNDLSQWYKERQELVEGFRRFHYAIRSGTDFIDVIECGHWKLDLLHRTVLEKGLDTRLAVDMVTLLDNYEVALLISGDADNIPCLDFVQSKGRHVAVVEFLGGYPPEKKGPASSSRLKVAADFVVQIYEMDLVGRSIAKKTP
jgi:uncharacterized LabA/DUF88 family protein